MNFVDLVVALGASLLLPFSAGREEQREGENGLRARGRGPGASSFLLPILNAVGPALVYGSPVASAA